MLNLDEFIPYKIATLSEKLSESFAKVYQDKYGLTVPQWRVIAHLAEQEFLTAKEICNRASLDKSTASRAIKQLLDLGVVKSEPSDKDKRAQRLSLTQDGSSLYNHLSLDAKIWQERLLDSLSKEDTKMLFKLLVCVEENSRL